jgi:glycosyltransferase involved in cell wall biosynthesis
LAERPWETRLRQKFPVAWLNGDRSAELVHVLRAVRPGKQDHLIIHSADPQTIDMLSIWVRGQLRNSLPEIHVRTCWPISKMPFADYGGGFSRVAQNLRAAGRAVTFSAETPAGARQLANEIGGDVNVCPHLLDEEILHLLPSDRSRGTLTIGWLGGLRREKGTEIFADIVGAVLTAKSQRLPLRFLLQYPGNSRRARNLQARLAEFGDAVEILNAVVSRDEYLAALNRCDVLLLPYDASAYPPERGSGLALEALLSGKPMIAMAGTFAATLIKPDSGAVGCDAQTLAGGILTVAKNYDIYARGAARERARARTSHNRDYCYRLLIGSTAH